MRTVPVTRMLSVFAFLLSILVAIPTSTAAQPANNGGPGNSGAAKMCQKDGWRTIAPAGSWVGFASQGECVSYGAQGGELAFLTGIVVPAGATVTFESDMYGSNNLWSSWSASDGSNGPMCVDQTSNGCRYWFDSISTIGSFPRGVVLTFTLEDRTCGQVFDSGSNHALVTPNSSGYQVDITDANLPCMAPGPRIPHPGTGNLTVSITFS